MAHFKSYTSMGTYACQGTAVEMDRNANGKLSLCIKVQSHLPLLGKVLWVKSSQS